jgi:hypothetical protein
LGRHLGVDARAAKEQELPYTGNVGGMDHIRLDREIVVYELGGIRVVGDDASDLRGSQEDVLGFLCFEELTHGFLFAQIQLTACT